MPGRPIVALELTEEEKSELEQLARSGREREARRARVILCRAKGMSQAAAAIELDLSLRSVACWCARFRRSGVDALRETAGRHTLRKSGKIQKEPNTPKHAPSPPQKRAVGAPSMKAVAEMSGVSTMTVSRVMRNQPNVSPEIRQAVIHAAKSLGYRPDPGIGKLMTHLRSRKTTGLQGAVCSIEASYLDTDPSIYFDLVRTGARRRAKELGFAWERFPFEEFLKKPEHSLNILHNRGIDGILLPPLPGRLNQRRLPIDIGWERFSVVTTTYAVEFPIFRRIVPDHFRNILLICETLSAEGYQRIGLAIPESLDQRVAYHYSGGFAAFHLGQRKPMLPPLLYQSPSHRFAEQRKWFEQHRPDALIVTSKEAAHDFAEELKPVIPKSFPLASVAQFDQTTMGIDELPKLIGAIAIESLAGMIMRNEKGIHLKPVVTMIPGEWKSGYAIP